MTRRILRLLSRVGARLSPWALIASLPALALGAQAGLAQTALPPSIPTVCAYNTALPTLLAGTPGYIQCDSAGRLLLAPSTTTVANQGSPNSGGAQSWWVQWAGQSVAVNNFPYGPGTAPAQSIATILAPNSTLPPYATPPTVLPGLYTASAPTLTSGAPSQLSTDINGKILIQGGNSTPLKTDSSATTQPISAVSLPLPSGASTSALQSSTQAAPGSQSTAATGVQGVTNGVPIPVIVQTSANILGYVAQASGNTSTVPWAIQEVGSSTPSSGIVPVVTQSGTSLLAKASAGNLYAYSAVNLSTTAGFVAVVNATAIPTSGTAIAPLECRILPASGSTDKSYVPGPPPTFSNGIVILVSSSCATYTPAGPTFLQALTR